MTFEEWREAAGSFDSPEETESAARSAWNAAIEAAQELLKQDHRLVAASKLRFLKTEEKGGVENAKR